MRGIYSCHLSFNFTQVSSLNFSMCNKNYAFWHILTKNGISLCTQGMHGIVLTFREVKMAGEMMFGAQLLNF